ncbi:MAG: HEAT repeat domain-containing protein [Gammaproteobacteria bacterium]|nr:HEAT repeat domain-containing protein [Gammaproteobacteria bacterium]
MLLIAGIFTSQAMVVYQRRIGDLIRERWAPVLRAARDDKPYKLPFLPRSHLPQLLELWTQHRQLAQPEQGERLDILARNLNLERSVKSILQPSVLAMSEKPVWIQNMALSAVKWLNSHTLMRYVYDAADSSNLYVAVSACRCLIRLRASDYEQRVISLLFRFPQHSAYIATELSRTDVAEILHLMEPFIDDMPSNMATNFISLADKSTDKELLPMLVRRLEKTDEGREVAILVRTVGRIGDSSHRNLVTPYLQDHRYYVRTQAIKALGKIGNAQDIELLIPFLSDREWWLRYRAAKAIVRLLKQDGEAVENLRDSLEDTFAREILKHALTEMNWCLR